MREVAGGDWASIDDFKLARHGFGLEWDTMALGEFNIDKRGRGTAVNHRASRQLDIMIH